MKQIFQNFVSIVFVILFSHVAFAADEPNSDLSLDDEFSDSQVPAQTDVQVPAQSTPETQVAPTDSANSLDLSEPIDIQTQDLPPATPDSNANIDPAENMNLASAQEILQSDNALYGFSLGMFYTQTTIKGSYKTFTKNAAGVLVADSNEQVLVTKPIQFVGVTARYAIFPFNSVGVDINLSYMQSVNHQNIELFDDPALTTEQKTLTTVLNIKGEMNLAYSFKIGKKLPIYFLAGVGFEKTSGRKILEVINGNGQGYQYGVGTVLFSSFNVEGLYTYYTHRISTQMRDALVTVNKNKDIDTDNPRFVSQGYQLRGTYSF